MAEEKYQRIFGFLFDTVTKKENDILTNKFINALILYGKADVQNSEYRDTDLAIVPRIINCEGKNITEISVLLEKLYTSRKIFCMQVNHLIIQGGMKI